MATLFLAAAGAAAGGAVGGTVLGVGAAALGKAVGATVGGLLDQRLLGGGARAVERGKVSGFRIQTSTEGAPVPRICGRMRVSGQIIWATRYKERVSETGGGKGGGGPTVREYSYSISLAIGLCEGRIERIGRVWADGKLFALGEVEHRLYPGDEDQGPDPIIEAVEGAGEAPSYRGVAYLVLEDLPLERFGNRVPQFTVEVFRAPKPDAATPEGALALGEIVEGVTLAPGTGEFALDTAPVRKVIDEGVTRAVNVNTGAGVADVSVALDQLEADLPACRSVSVVVSWFGTDLRCDRCELWPGVETADAQTDPETWSVTGVGRAGARVVSQDDDGRPLFGGTPSDGSVTRLIQDLKERGYRVVFYPFILMDIPGGNGLTDPWTEVGDQPAFPWRGRITASLAPGRPGSPDKTAAAEAEVDAFFGAAAAGDFTPNGETIAYAGPVEWSFRRFVLHYAHLCAAAGGVDAFCIGSELRGLTQLRSGPAAYPAVASLATLAADVRGVLGGGVKLGYAADWSEYFGHQPGDGSGDVLFHLDPLWADPQIDFVGIDYYAPLADWRYEEGHLDSDLALDARDLSYLASNVEGGEGYDWYYASDAARDAQERTPIVDTAHGEDWIFRPKDLRNWWSNPHHNRPGGVRTAAPTAWVPGSKPIWLTELGCPAVDLGANQPNVFYDPKSSESALPHYSRGVRDDHMQRRFIQALLGYWRDAANNPVSAAYGGEMVDVANCHVWTWDARPWPEFPLRTSVWSDGGNHALGHWLTGRAATGSLAEVVAEICGQAGLDEIDVSGLYGVVNGFVQERTQTARAALQTLMLAYGFDAVESAGVVKFVMRGAAAAQIVAPEMTALSEEGADETTSLERRREAAGETPAVVRVGYLRAEQDYRAAATEAASPAGDGRGVEESDLPLALSGEAAQAAADRWIVEAHLARDKAGFAVPPSAAALEPGDVVRFGSETALWRVDRIEDADRHLVEATRVERAIYRARPRVVTGGGESAAPDLGPLGYRLMDLPIGADGAPTTKPLAAVWGDPWPGAAAVYASDSDDGYALSARTRRAAVAGRTLTTLPAASPWRWTRGAGLRVRLFGGQLLSRSATAVLNGANAAAVEAAPGVWEIMQFREAELVAPGEWALRGLLRGQVGTETCALVDVPAGASFVLLDGAVAPLALSVAERGLERHFRVGPASLPYSDPLFGHEVRAFDIVGLRPYAPAHLRVRRTGSDLAINWIRRTRVNGDGWDGETPLGEERELYRVRISDQSGVLREADVPAPAFDYDAAMQAADGASGPLTISVAQISMTYGPGPETRVTISD